MANPSLQLRITQKLAMAPQLQQAIRLLQLTRIELREHIQELVDSNPLLDHEENTEQPEQPEQNSKEDSSEFETTEAGKSENEQEYSADDYDDQQWQSEQDPWTDSGGWSDDFSERQFEDTSSGSLRE
ncbi:MAG: hypothetical protein QNK19_05360, partial [Xanthomonadales bacterium]|nr:hypothetical protein [Xanthomonadales bacterium]